MAGKYPVIPEKPKMEAKDTAMTVPQIQATGKKWGMDRPGPFARFDEWLCLEQAKISFLAGQEEVVNWVKHNIHFTDNQDMPRLFSLWKAKLKEWEIDRLSGHCGERRRGK